MTTKPVNEMSLAEMRDTWTEAGFQRAVCNVAHALGWTIYHTHDSRRSQAGFPDLTMARRERLVFAELKSAKGRIRPEQLAWRAVLSQTPAQCFIWRPSDWDLIEAVLS